MTDPSAATMDGDSGPLFRQILGIKHENEKLELITGCYNLEKSVTLFCSYHCMKAMKLHMPGRLEKSATLY
jgi:hypothetical protein